MTPLAVPTPRLPDGALLALALSATGMTDLEIAEQIGTPAPLVRTRMTRLLAVLGVESRGIAVALAYRYGWFNQIPARYSGRPLSRRQLELGQLVVEGRTSREIRAALSIEPDSVQKLTCRTYKRTGARNRGHLVRILVDTGLVEIPRRPPC